MTDLDSLEEILLKRIRQQEMIKLNIEIHEIKTNNKKTRTNEKCVDSLRKSTRLTNPNSQKYRERRSKLIK